MTNRFLRRKVLVLALLVTSIWTTTAYSQQKNALFTPAQETSQSRTESERRVATAPFIRTELFFGTKKPDGVVSDEEFNWFLDAVVTPEFPDGLTLLTGTGQFRGSDGIIIQEKSFLLILLYPLETKKESSEKIERIRRAYKRYFQQESVLRVDDARPAQISF
jgi:hypothetical protein